MISVKFKFVAMAWLMLIASAWFVPTPALAQINPEIANCEEIKDPDTQFQADLCSAHVGCKLVFAVHKTCAKAKSFLTRLKTSIGEGVDSIFGKKKEITADHLFEASLSEFPKKLSDFADGKPMVDELKQGAAPHVKSLQTFKQNDGKQGLWYGQLKDGSPVGYGTSISGNGFVSRRKYNDEGQIVMSDFINHENDRRTIGEFAAGEYSGRLVSNMTNGNVFSGIGSKGNYSNVKLYSASGQLMEEGQYRDNKLYVGKKYAPDGTVTDVNVPREQMAAAEQRQQEALKREREAREAKAQAEEQKRQAQRRAEQEFQTSLDTLNPGQLFAKADEYSAAGQADKARQTLRALVSKYPNHPLAATAAQQMSAMSAPASAPAAASQAGASGAGRNSGSGGAGASGTGNCDALLAQQDREFAQLNNRPMPNGATPPLMRLMYMTQETIKVIQANCPALPKYQQMLQEMKRTYDQAETACNQLSTGRCAPNPYR